MFSFIFRITRFPVNKILQKLLLKKAKTLNELEKEVFKFVMSYLITQIFITYITRGVVVNLARGGGEGEKLNFATPP